jgi:hypothetical protein
MTPTRYFRSGRMLWKFAPGKAPVQRHQFDDEWDSSLFVSLEEFLSEPGDAMETNEEDAEL